MSDYKKKSREKFGSDYELYEGDLAEIVQELDRKRKLIFKNLKMFLAGEMDYWLAVNPTVCNFISELDEEGNYNGW